MLNHSWEFYVKPGNEELFEKLNGSDGEWADFFMDSEAFHGTSYQRNAEQTLIDKEPTTRYETHDLWDSQADFEQFVAENMARFVQLSEENNALIFKKNELGWFPVNLAPQSNAVDKLQFLNS